jgi:phospholipid/cholesterol/gamma-HCH transport system substrate-binding protein
MIFGKSSMELKVGVFVFVGLVILTIFMLFIGDFKTTFSAYKVKFVFNFINGVKIGSPVRFAGVDVGEVRDIEFIFTQQGQPPKVQMTGWIKKDIKIPHDSTVWVNTLGLLGEKYIEIMPGKDYSILVKENDQMFGNDPFAMQEFGELARSVAEKLDSTLVGIEEVALSLKSLTENVNDGVNQIKSGQGTVGKLMYDEKLYNELEALVVDIRKHPWKLLKVTKDKSK